MRDSLRRPYPVTLPMVAFVSLIPLYLFIPALAVGPVSFPEVAIDRLVPLRPAWSLVYGAVYLFLILLPVFVVQRQEHVRRAVHAYLAIWITSYVCFVLYPTAAPRPGEVPGTGFTAWGLRFLYSSDPPFNCFPSLHVAHSFVSAVAAFRVHRGVGVVALACASLVGLSTLFTKQHWVVDVVAGMLLALVACLIFLRPLRPDDVPPLERRLAPALASVVAGAVTLVVLGFWVAYRVGFRS